MTISASRGSSTSMSLRLCSRAPEMTIRSDAATDLDSTQTNRCSRKCSLHLYRYTEQMKGALPQHFRHSAAVDAGCGIGGVGLAEDANDSAAEEVPRLVEIETARRGAVAGQLAQRLDQALDRGVTVAAVEGGEGVGAEAGLRQADPGR